MSKELEALKNIVNEISNYKLHGLGDENWLGIQDVMSDIDILEKALTPPTEQEVCEELSEYLGTRIIYDNTLKTFTEIKGGRARGRIIARLRVNKINIPHDLPPHLIEMLGKFYKGKVKEND